MPTPRKRLDQLKESGTYQRHVGRYKGRVAALEGFVPLGPPSSYLDAREADCWREIERNATTGTLAASDFVIVEMASRYLARYRFDFENFTTKDGNLLQSLMRDLGMTTATRGRVTPAKALKEEGAITKLMNGRLQ